MTDFYVYFHKKATTGEIFYVGKGSGRRAYDKSSRSKWWYKVVAKHGFVVEIYMDKLTEWYALELEQDMISYYGRKDQGYGDLINVTDGGTGLVGYIHSEENRAKRSARLLLPENPMRDQSIYTFVNTKTLEEFVGTRYEFIKTYNLNIKGLFCGKKTVKSWCLKENLEIVLLGNPVIDRTIYNFLHNDGEKFTGTRVEFKKKYSIEIGDLFRKGTNFVKGWRLDDGKNKTPLTDTTIYTLFNRNSGEVYIGTRVGFRSVYRDNIESLLCYPQMEHSCNWQISGEHSKFVHSMYSILSKDTGEIFEGTRHDFKKKYPEVGRILFAESRRTFSHGWKVIEKRPFCLYIP